MPKLSSACRSPLSRLSASFIAGALLTLAFAPYAYWPIAIISPAIFCWALVERGLSWRSAYSRAFAFNLGLFSFGASWVYVSIHDFGFTAAWLAVVLTSLFVLLLACISSLPWLLFKFFKQSPLVSQSLLLFPALFVFGEHLRSWLFTGFPWLFAGYAHIDSPLAGWAPIIGVFGLSFFSALLGALVYICLYSFSGKARQTHRLNFGLNALALSLILLLISSGQFLRSIEWTQSYGEKQVVALLQPNVALPLKWNPFYHSYIKSDLEKLAKPWWQADIQVWPEAAIPGLRSDALDFIDEMHGDALQHNSNVFSGVLWDTDSGDVYNGIVAFGKAKGNYFKQKLVPFGEYVPFEKQLRGLIAFFDLPNSIIERGPYQPDALSFVSRDGKQHLISAFICYEVVYPDFVANSAQNSSMMLTISNDAWFGKSIGPLQHFEMARMRALENQKYMLRSTNTGITAIIGERGQITEQARQFSETSVVGVAELRSGTTPFARFSSWPVMMLCLSLLISAALRQLLSNQRSTNAQASKTHESPDNAP
ncbi:apolipoprotein N-acyltransferase [Agaribacterium haliotis]|uniref:apolipoprotein N-acyltransferase n=1 Tax=Agaribacterium haliotis TaxID=2013869 RepID=UPI000BB567CD|nr:apolipoprotein N-acyltransferase [Agaribacterium haliotis]